MPCIYSFLPSFLPCGFETGLVDRQIDYDVQRSASVPHREYGSKSDYQLHIEHAASILNVERSAGNREKWRPMLPTVTLLEP